MKHRKEVRAMIRLAAAVIGVAVVLGMGCIFQARNCCECMATKEAPFGIDCVDSDSIDTCAEALSKDPPDVDVVNEWCRAEGNEKCADSCKDILYRD